MARLTGVIVYGSMLLSLSINDAIGAERKMDIVFKNMSEADVSVQITPDGSGASYEFTKQPLNEFKYTLTLTDTDWFYRVPVTIIWKNAFLRPGSHAKPEKEYRQWIVLRLRRDRPIPPNFRFKMYFSNDGSLEEMHRLETNANLVTKDGDLLSELYLRGQQIADYYREAPGASLSLKRYAAQLWFEGAIQLAELPLYYVEVSEEAAKLARQFNVASAVDVNKRVLDANSMYWEDLGLVNDLINEGNCDGARTLFVALKDRKVREKNYFDARKQAKRTSESELENTGQTLSARCPL